jgi:hypothetical protein
LLALVCLFWLGGCGASSPQAANAEKSQASAETWLDPIVVVTGMRGSEDDYRRCFMRAMNERGIVETEFEVGSRGEVVGLEVVRSTIGRTDVAECLADEMRKRRFESDGRYAKGRWTCVFRLTDPIEKKEYEKRLEIESERQDAEGVVVDAASRGQLAVERIEETVTAAYPLFARCYRDAISRSGRAGGILRLRLVIGAEGRLVELGDAGTVLPDPYAVDCIAESFYAMRFPEPSGGPVQANYRLEFY